MDQKLDLAKFNSEELTNTCDFTTLQTFQQSLYKQILAMEKNTLICAICHDEIGHLTEICRPKCTCNLWYHLECLSQSYKDPNQSGACLQCRQERSLYNWETALKKFWISSKDWKQLYHQTYDKACKNNLYAEMIHINTLFFGDIKIYRKKLPNYILLPFYDFENYLTFDEKLFLETTKEYQNLPNKKKILFTTPLYKNGELVVVSHEQFQNKLREFSYGLLTDFNWNNVFLAGGSLFRLLSPKFSNLIPDTSDLDLFIYGANHTERKQTLERIMKYFTNKYNNDVFFVLHEQKALIDVYVRGISRHIQLICNEANSIIEIIELFDCSHVQLCYLNNKLYATPSALKSIKLQMNIGNSMSTHRIHKALGFHLATVLLEQKNVSLPKKLTYHNENKNTPEIEQDMFGEHKICGEHILDVTHSNISNDLYKNLKTLPHKPPIIDTTYHPRFEESDETVIQTLRGLNKNTDTIITKDVTLVLNKIKFINRDNIEY